MLMKLYGKICIIVIISLCIIKINSINEIEIASARPWCWTKPALGDPSFILNESNGGINWGFCRLGSIQTMKKKEFYVYILTSQMPNSSTISKVLIQLIGKEDVSEEMVLSYTGFKAGSYEKIKVFTKDVGNLNSIKLITRGSDSYRCDSIKIESDIDSWNFECEEVIKCPHCSTELFVVSLSKYEVTIKTSSIESSGTSNPIYIQFWGTDRISPKKLLSDIGLVSGSTVTLTVNTINVGNLYAVNLNIIGHDEYLPEEVIVKYNSALNGRQERVFRNKENEILENEDKTLMLKLPKPNSTNDSELEEVNKNFNSKLSAKEKLLVQKISCVDIVKDNQVFGPRYYTNFVNYNMYLVECPSNCMKYKSRVYGLGIHPEESPICISAIIDRMTSFYGGIIAVNILSGLSSYTGGKKIFTYQIEGFGTSKRSFTITKVDNNDLISKDVRILDHNGVPSYKGRVELRYEGIWGTICNQNLDQTAAKVICIQIGYKDGAFLGQMKEETIGFCSNYEGLDYCGAPAAKILFSNISCQGNEFDIFDCYRQMADLSSCSHKYDTIIECVNTDIEEPYKISPGTVRLIDFTGNPTQNGIGRLEVLNENWGSICNRNFDDNSATVACKQMGYNGGKIFGIQDSQDMCSNVLGSNLCGDFNQKIKYTDLKCLGNEKNIKECAFSDITVSCTHFNDVIVKCDGIGDSSGKLQNIKKPKVLSPLIEKQPMPPTINAKCNTNLKSKDFRGDPGSIFLVNCPSNCELDTSSVTGTGVYSIDSSICKAAIHTGVISNEGGNVLIGKTYGQNRFFSSTLRKISSLESQYLKLGFFLSTPTSAHFNLVSDFNNNSSDGESSFLELSNNLIEYTKGKLKYLKINENQDYKQSIRLKQKNSKLGQGLVHKDYKFKHNINDYNCESNFYDYNNFSSFIEIETKVTKPGRAIYEWTMPNNEFSFNGSKGVDLMTIVESKKIFELKTFTILIKLRMEHFAEDSNIQTLFSIGGCEGYSISIDNNTEIVFNVKCGSNIFKSSIFVPLSYDVKIYVVFDGNDLSFYLDGKKFDHINTYFNLHYKQMMSLGKSSEYEKDYFMGKIYFFAIFYEPMSENMISKIEAVGYEKPELLRKNKFVTLDERQCISSCANQVTPGTPGSPEPPKDAITFDFNGVNSIIPGESEKLKHEKQGKMDEIEPLIEINCTQTVRELIKNELKENIKKRVKCPKDCYKKKGPIFGTFIYTIDSSICLSAIHSGVIKGIHEANIEITTNPALPTYLGSKQYNFMSASIDKSELSFSVQNATPVILVDCKTLASEPNFSGTIGMTFIVECPADCSKVPSNVFGGNKANSQKQQALYSGNTSICKSAIHAGVLNDKGGEVQFSIREGAKLYYGSKAYGIESKSRDYFVKSISFFTSTNPLSANFKEEFSTNLITEKWIIEDNHQAENFPSKWEYTTPIGLKSNKFVIKQSSKVRVIVGELNYGSILLIKGIDVVNVLYKVTFYFINLSPVGMIFRYKDINNYYHLRINENSYGNYKLILVKRYEGKSTILATSDMTIVPRLTYSFLVYQYFDSFKVSTIIGELKNLLTIMEIKDNDLQRGGIGLATNGNDDFYVSNVFVEPYEGIENEKSINGRNLDVILRENTKLHREKFCKSKYKEYNKTLECKEYHNYCRMVCDKEIDRKENIMNFICYNKCVKDAILKLKLTSIEQDTLGLGIESNIWSPKDGEKCDFKPDDEGHSFWTPCFIKQVKNNPSDPEQKFVQIKYMIGGQERVGNILYPNITLKKCGEMLGIRKDCSSIGIDLPDLEKQTGGKIEK